MTPIVAALGVAADPFAAPRASSGTLHSPGAPSQAGCNMDSAFQAIREAELAPVGAAGLPGKNPGWLLPVIVGVVALAIGGAVTLAFMR